MKKTRKQTIKRQKRNRTSKKGGFKIPYMGIIKSRDPARHPKHDQYKQEMNTLVFLYYSIHHKIPDKIDDQVLGSIRERYAKMRNYNPTPESLQQMNMILANKLKSKGYSYWCNQQWRNSVYDDAEEDLTCRNNWSPEEFEALKEYSLDLGRIPRDVFRHLSYNDRYTLCRFWTNNLRGCQSDGRL